MKQNNNIEEIFKESFENFSPEVDPALFNGIQAKMQANTAGSAASSATGISGVAKIGLVAAVATIVGVSAVFYVYSDNNGESQEKNQSVQNDVIDNQNETKTKEKDETIVEEEVKEEIVVHHTDDPVVEIIKKEREEEKKVKEKEISKVKTDEIEETNANVSVVDGFITPREEQDWSEFNKNKNNQQESSDATNNETTVETIVSQEKTDNKEIESVANETEVAVQEKEVVFGVIPNVFTPNNDGKNDTFVFEVSNAKEVIVIISSFDGKYQLEVDDWKKGWDGRDSFGQELPEDNYLYIIKAIGENDTPFEKTGKVTLRRR